jgi:ubiquitin carboxyl-terminal hydrolase 8
LVGLKAQKAKHPLIKALFDVKVTHFVRCEKCGHQRELAATSPFNSYWGMPLKTPASGGKYKVKQLLNLQIDDDLRLPDDYRFVCENPDGTCDSIKYQAVRGGIEKLPEILMLNFQRGTFGAEWTTEFKDYKVFIEEKLDMKDLALNNTERTKYDLCAVVKHIGDLDTGHYIAFVKDAAKNWWRCDDLTISDKKTLYTTTTPGFDEYLAFYRRMPAGTSPKGKGK